MGYRAHGSDLGQSNGVN